MLGFLLQRSAFPVDIVHGEEPLATDDWGYGPQQYLTPDRVQVQLAADILQQTTYDQLIRDVDPSELAKSEVYPHIWDSPASLEWPATCSRPLRSSSGVPHPPITRCSSGSTDQPRRGRDVERQGKCL
ncbi:DUF1877 family protein [Streptomyces sp. NPDC058613]|uniref:DUF1877 family protein n=1 Tax=unclassified Streptomyces TaxID=2593676 RepID=UPI00364CB1C6